MADSSTLDKIIQNLNANQQQGEALGKDIWSDQQVQPGDEQKYNPNFRNWLVNKMGLPQYQINAADEKKVYADMPNQMGMSMGTIANVAPAMVEQAAAKMAAPIAEQVAGKMTKPLNAAEQYLKSSGITVIDSAADKAAKKFGNVTLKAPPSNGSIIMIENGKPIKGSSFPVY